jgi:hypothetical protein
VDLAVGRLTCARFITADAGCSNGYRLHVWKHQRQRAGGQRRERNSERAMLGASYGERLHAFPHCLFDFALNAKAAFPVSEPINARSVTE